MPRLIKPGVDHAAIRKRLNQKQHEHERSEEKLAETARKADLALDGIKPERGKIARRDIGRVLEQNDPTLLQTAEWVLAKAVMGFTVRQIAALSEEELGYRVSDLKVRRFIAKEMQRRKDPLVREIRRREDMRLDYLLTKLETKVNEGDVQAIHEARLISESRRRMFGADMPTNVRVTGEFEHKLDPAVTKMIEESKERIRQQQASSAKSELEDPAIIDAEVVDDEPDYREEPYQEFPSDDDDPSIEVDDL